MKGLTIELGMIPQLLCKKCKTLHLRPHAVDVEPLFVVLVIESEDLSGS